MAGEVQDHNAVVHSSSSTEGNVPGLAPTPAGSAGYSEGVIGQQANPAGGVISPDVSVAVTPTLAGIAPQSPDGQPSTYAGPTSGQVNRGGK
jgi:hypothetical protein